MLLLLPPPRPSGLFFASARLNTRLIAGPRFEPWRRPGTLRPRSRNVLFLEVDSRLLGQRLWLVRAVSRDAEPECVRGEPAEVGGFNGCSNAGLSSCQMAQCLLNNAIFVALEFLTIGEAIPCYDALATDVGGKNALVLKPSCRIGHEFMAPRGRAMIALVIYWITPSYDPELHTDDERNNRMPTSRGFRSSAIQVASWRAPHRHL